MINHRQKMLERNLCYTLLEVTLSEQQTDAQLRKIKQWLSHQPASERRENLLRKVENHQHPVELKWESEETE